MSLYSTVTVPDSPSDLGLSETSWWPTQKETVQRILEAFSNPAIKYVLANMPTGSGKTLVASAVQRMMDVGALNLTHTIMLQEQYRRTLPWALTVTGRRNHACLLAEDLVGTMTAEDAPCAHGEDCPYIAPAPQGCSYYSMLYEADTRRQLVSNYAYAVRIIQTPKLKRLGSNPLRKPLMVCDEGHLAEDAIVSANQVMFYRSTWAKWSPPTESVDIEVWQKWSYGVLPRLKAELSELGPPDSIGALKSRSRLRAMINSAEFLQKLDADDLDGWILVPSQTGTALRPIWGWAVSRNLWSHSSKVLIMSATLGDPKILCWKLGIPEAETVYMEAPSTFPAENRPVFYWPLARLSRNTPDSEWDRVAEGIRWIANQPRLREKKGVIHTGSFKVAKELIRRLQANDPDCRYMTHLSSGSTQPGLSFTQALMIFEHTNSPLILVSPSMTTGVDLPYVIGWQVIAKMPFGDLSDPVVKARRDYRSGDSPIGRHSYDADTMNTVVQAAGRAVRTPTDQGTTYILDGHFWPLFNRTYAPEHFRKSVLWLRRT